jgi:hypothetical protein
MLQRGLRGLSTGIGRRIACIIGIADRHAAFEAGMSEADFLVGLLDGVDPALPNGIMPTEE